VTKAKGLYLGKQVDPASGALGAVVELDPADLVTHGVVVGMTGSGKTGLAVALIEELLRQGVPVLAVDPKGDLGNLLLLFERLDPASFAPWVDPEAARRQGQTVEQAAEAAAADWTRGLAEWGLSASDVAQLAGAREAVIFTPGSGAGVPLNVLGALDAPPVPFDSAEEDLRDEIAAIVRGLLSLVNVDADPLRSREAILLANLIESHWRAGDGLTLERLVGELAEPPFDKLGALPLESVYPRKERQQLAVILNNLLASPSFGAWREGEPLDVDGLLRAPDGRPRLSIVYTAHLPEEQRLFVTALLLEKVKTWVRRQPGTSRLRALVYLDEVFGYLPPHPADPPTKKPLLTLLKQARAQGLGVLMATQNPVDLDYKALGNMGVWLVGKLQTDQDRGRLRDGLVGSGGMEAATVERLLEATRKRVFLLHDVHRPAPCLLHSRWALCYLRGPLTREEVARLMAGRQRGAPAAAASVQESGAPPLPAPLRHHYWRKYGGQLAEAHLMVKYAVRYDDAGELQAVRAWPLGGAAVAEALEGSAVDVDEAAVATEAPAGVRHAQLPAYLAGAGVRGLESALKQRLPDRLALTLWSDPATRTVSRPGETREAFAARLQQAGGGPRAERLREQIQRKSAELAARRQDLTGRRSEKWVAIGTAILSNIGLLTGRKRTISGAGSVLSKNRMENTAEVRVAALESELAELQRDLDSLASVDVARFEEKVLVPARGDVKILRYDVLWVY
jgi:hypothetical protein